MKSLNNKFLLILVLMTIGTMAASKIVPKKATPKSNYECIAGVDFIKVLNAKRCSDNQLFAERYNDDFFSPLNGPKTLCPNEEIFAIQSGSKPTSNFLCTIGDDEFCCAEFLTPEKIEAEGLWKVICPDATRTINVRIWCKTAD
jgi:hypothetical protein